MKPHADKTADDAWQDDHLRLELKRLQKELDDCRRQLARKEGILFHAAEAIFLMEAGGRFAEANPAACSLLGYSREELLTMDSRDLLPDVSREEILATLDAAKSGERITLQTASRCKDGRRKTIEMRLARCDSGGGLFIVTCRDVTDAQEAQEEARAHLWFLENMDRINRAIQATNDLDEMMSEVLKACLSIFDCDRAWLVYPCDPTAASWRAVMEHVRPGFPGAFALGVELPMDAEASAVFGRARETAGSVIFDTESEDWMHTQLAKRFNIRSIIALAVYPKLDKPYLFGLHQCRFPRAWTSREQRFFQEIGRRIEDALSMLLMFRRLERSEAKLEEAQRITHVGYWDRDLDSDIISWSNETYRIFGRERQAGGFHLSELAELIHPEDRTIMIEAVAEAIRGGQPYNVEYRAIRPDGEVRIVHSLGALVRDESGRPRRMFGTVQDITEQKHAEIELRQREADLRKLNAELAHMSRATTMGELAASIAHEVNQPIAGVVLNGNTCLRWLDRIKEDSVGIEEARQSLHRIIRDANRAGEVIARVRALFKKGEPAREPVDLNRAIREVIALMKSEMERRKVTLRLELADKIPLVIGDRVQLQQVMMNLILNAIEAMSRAEHPRRDLIIKTEPSSDGEVLATVADSGPGLDAGSVEQIFAAFHTTKPGGLGMGLSICRSIIASHGGRIWAAATDGPGATFHFVLCTTP